jgi:hypothetical protein
MKKYPRKNQGEKLMCSNNECKKFRVITFRVFNVSREMICHLCKSKLIPFVSKLEARERERIKKELEAYDLPNSGARDTRNSRDPLPFI